MPQRGNRYSCVPYIWSPDLSSLIQQVEIKVPCNLIGFRPYGLYLGVKSIVNYK